jgi:hypothetical protein
MAPMPAFGGGAAWSRAGSSLPVLTDWAHRYPLIVEAALRNRTASFVDDGEAVLLDVDGISDFNGLHSRKHDDEVQLYAFDVLALEGEDRLASWHPFGTIRGRVLSGPLKVRQPAGD